MLNLGRNINCYGGVSLVNNRPKKFKKLPIIIVVSLIFTGGIVTFFLLTLPSSYNILSCTRTTDPVSITTEVTYSSDGKSIISAKNIFYITYPDETLAKNYCEQPENDKSSCEVDGKTARLTTIFSKDEIEQAFRESRQNGFVSNSSDPEDFSKDAIRKELESEGFTCKLV
jgi:hypothetical protein